MLWLARFLLHFLLQQTSGSHAVITNFIFSVNGIFLRLTKPHNIFNKEFFAVGPTTRLPISFTVLVWQHQWPGSCSSGVKAYTDCGGSGLTLRRGCIQTSIPPLFIPEGLCSEYSDWVRGWTVWGSNPGRRKTFSLLKTSREAQSPIRWKLYCFPGSRAVGARHQEWLVLHHFSPYVPSWIG